MEYFNVFEVKTSCILSVLNETADTLGYVIFVRVKFTNGPRQI